MNRGRASLGLAPTANHGHFRDTAGGGKPLPYGMDGDKSCGGGRAATEGRPYGGFRTSYGSGGRQAPVSRLWRLLYHV